MSVTQRLPAGQRGAAEEGEEEDRGEPLHAPAPGVVPREGIAVGSPHDVVPSAHDPRDLPRGSQAWGDRRHPRSRR
jgi:hypothetical protein